MTKKPFRLFIFFLTMGLFIVFFGACKKSPEKISTIAIPELKRTLWQKFIDKTVLIEGIFVKDPLPMLVTDLKFVLINSPIPRDQYIILSGKLAEEIDSKKIGGARIKLSGTLKRITDKKAFFEEDFSIWPDRYEIIERIKEYAPIAERMKIITQVRPPLFRYAKRFAILFSGGFNTLNNHTRYWNDLVFMYSTLINKYEFTDDNIYVLYADGTALNTDMTVDYSATLANLQTVINDLSKTTDSNTTIFVFTTNHGGGFLAESLTGYNMGGQIDADGDEGEEPLYESIYNADITGDGDRTDQFSWDEVLYSWGGDIDDDDFHSLFSGIKYEKLIVVMEQCFSGGLIFDISQSQPNRIIMSAAGEYQFSWGSSNVSYDEFSYHFTCAINGADPSGNSINADSNNDRRVSILEAFNYARSQDTQPETPWYEDSGDGVAHSGNMPANGEGKLGANTYLEKRLLLQPLGPRPLIKRPS